ncbi:uncharacterized protein A4U43_C05F24600 [Asparagus officinalis]|uniref:Uncharacterized protein n=1 Tax=Asparagus officinalis TaxID=4686 RepID=A0A5P1EVM3_ASPOF|nr:uncharacterized protein A4U43_C05F24600 [Asparagus officinalis]
MSDRRREKLRDRDHRDRDRDRERDRERDRSIARAQSRDRDRDRRPRPAPRKRSAHRPRQHRSAHQKKLPPRRGVHRRHSHRRSHPTPPHRRKRPREESEEAKESREEGVPRVREAKDDGKLLGMAAGATDVDAKRWQMMKMLGIPLGFDSTKGAGCLMPIRERVNRNAANILRTFSLPCLVSSNHLSLFSRMQTLCEPSGKEISDVQLSEFQQLASCWS